MISVVSNSFLPFWINLDQLGKPTFWLDKKHNRYLFYLKDAPYFPLSEWFITTRYRFQRILVKLLTKVFCIVPENPKFTCRVHLINKTRQCECFNSWVAVASGLILKCIVSKILHWVLNIKDEQECSKWFLLHNLLLPGLRPLGDKFDGVGTQRLTYWTFCS